jgi:HB1, ASXL, restriction endonuclease HTH domain
MDAPYEELRKQAAAKRDKIIQAAQQEYRVAVRRIRALHKLVTGDHHPAIRPPRRAKDRTLTELLVEVLPSNRAFTVADACELVYDDPLGCKYKETSIRSQLTMLANVGRLHKVGRRSGHILWSRTEAGIEPAVFGTLTTCEIAEQIIRERGPLRLMEIVMIMKERGYRPEEPNHTTYAIMRRSMTRISGRFVKDNRGRWGVAQLA